MSNNEPQCRNCQFWWLEDPATEGSVAIGQCRRRAPLFMLAQMPALLIERCSVGSDPPDRDEVSDHGADAVWPRTRDWDWCGEFQPEADER